MKFDKSKVYTTFNVDEVKSGSKGYFADFKEDLIHCVESEDEYFYGSFYKSLNNNEFTFILSKSESKCDSYRYFYLVEEPKEKTKRTCTKEELIEMLKKQGLPMLMDRCGYIYTIKAIYSIIEIADEIEQYTYDELCNKFTLLDGTELWVEE